LVQSGLTPHFGGRRAPAKCSTRFSGTRTGPHTTPRYPKSRRRWRYAWARNAACSRFTPHDCFSLSTLGALNPLRFNRHYRPLLDRHAGIIENLRDDCQAPVSPAVAGLCDHRGGRGARQCLRWRLTPRRGDEATTRRRRGTPAHPCPGRRRRAPSATGRPRRTQRPQELRSAALPPRPRRALPTPPTRPLRPLSAS